MTPPRERVITRLRYEKVTARVAPEEMPDEPGFEAGAWLAATGGIGSGVARAFAREGAHVWLSGRDAAALAALAEGTRVDGGVASADAVDATDPDALAADVGRVTEQAGRVDVVFNGIGGRPVDLGYAASSPEQGFDAFFRPLRVIVGSTFLTTRTAGAQMARQGGGAIVTLSATLSGVAAGVARVRELGGQADEPVEIPSGTYSGTYARCRDDQGTPFSLWRAKAGG